MNQTQLTAPSTFDQMMQVAEVLSHNELLPEHLRGKKKGGVFEEFTEVQRRSICFSVVNAANLWGCNPFMLAEQSFSVHGKLDYSGAFYAALANTRGKLDQKLSHEFSGTGPDRRIVVFGRLQGEATPRTATMTVFDGKRTGNAPTWETDPDQMLIYACSRRWVRRHCPQVLLGLTPESEETPESVVTAPAVDAPKIEATKTDYTAAIAQAQDQERLKEIAGLIGADDSISGDERQLFLQMGRDAYAGMSRKNKDAQEKVKYADPSEAYQRWERTLLTELVAERLVEHLDAIMADKDVSEDEANKLHKIVNQQIEAGKKPVETS